MPDVPAFLAHTTDTADPAACAHLSTTQDAFGFVPAPVARMAESPQLLEGFMSLNRIFAASSLTPLEREVLILTIATRVRCHYCVAMHTATLARLRTAPSLIATLRAGGALRDVRLEQLRIFTNQVLDTAGGVDDAQLAAFLAAGFDHRAALDVVLGIGTYTLSTFANRLTRAPLDEPFEQYAWQPA